MKIKEFIAFMTIVLLLVAETIFYIQPVYSQGENYVVIEPPEPSTAGVPAYAVTPGQTVLVNVTIINAVDIYGYNITFYWDNPDLVEFVDAYFHPFLQEPYSYKVTRVGNRVTVYAKSQDPANPVSGSGVLVTIYYTAKIVGESLIRFDVAQCYLIRQDGTLFSPSTFKRGKLVVTKTRIVVEPEMLSAAFNETVAANITVYEVVNLYGIEFKLIWDPTILTVSRVHYQVPWTNKFEVRNETGLGYYLLAVSGMYPATAYTGNFTFVNIEFNVTRVGFSFVSFEYSKLGNDKSQQISHARVDSVFSNVNLSINFEPAIISDISIVEGNVFSVNLTITEAVNLKDFEIRISYPELLNVSSVIFNEIELAETAYRIDPVTRLIVLNGSFYTEYVGDYVVATIELTVVGFGSGKMTIISPQTQLKDGEGNSLPFKTSTFTFANWRNVSISGIKFESNIRLGKKFLIGEPITVSVLVENIGASAESVNLTISYQGNVTVEGNATEIFDTIYNTTLFLEKFGELNSSMQVTFLWNTTGLKAGDYYVSINATIEVDHDLTDNVLIEKLELVEFAVDVSVFNVLVVPPVVNTNESVILNIIVKNLGLQSQTFDLLVYLDGNLIETFENITLNGGSGDIIFVVLPGFPEPGRHLLNFTIPPVPKETRLENNYYVKSLVVGLTSSSLPIEIILPVVVVAAAILAVAAFYLKRRSKR